MLSSHICQCTTQILYIFQTKITEVTMLSPHIWQCTMLMILYIFEIKIIEVQREIFYI
jgi:hypothetical protein